MENKCKKIQENMEINPLTQLMSFLGCGSLEEMAKKNDREYRLWLLENNLKMSATNWDKFNEEVIEPRTREFFELMEKYNN